MTLLMELPAKKKHLEIVCTECGLSWMRHPRDATLRDCIALLKEDLAILSAIQ